MTTLSDRLGLKRHTTADAFHVADYADNWAVLDDFPGIYICTSGTRPTWAAAQEGMSIYETDKKLVWHWDGAAWERLLPQGLLAHAQITADINTAATSYQVAVTANAVVAAGGRRVQITAAIPSVASTASFTWLAIYRAATKLTEWANKGGAGATVDDREEPEFVTIFDQPAAASYAYTIQYRADATYAGTSTLAATANSPISLTVVEV